MSGQTIDSGALLGVLRQRLRNLCLRRVLARKRGDVENINGWRRRAIELVWVIELIERCDDKPN